MKTVFNQRSALSQIPRPSPSLRLAFWSAIFVSSIFWILALLLGAGLITACSGSIFSDGKGSPPAPPPGGPIPEETIVMVPGPERVVPPAPGDAPRKNTLPEDNPPGRQIVTGPSTKNLPSPPANAGRDHALVPGLGIYNLLFPGATQRYLQSAAGGSQRLDALARLRLSITLHKASPEEIKMAQKLARKNAKGSPIGIRSLSFSMYEGAKELAKLRTRLQVPEDHLDGSHRVIFATGYLENDGRKRFMSLTFFLRDGQLARDRNSYITSYADGEEKEKILLDQNAAIGFSIEN